MGVVPCFDLGNGAVCGVVVDNELMVYHVTLPEHGVQTILDVVLDVVAGDDDGCTLRGWLVIHWCEKFPFG